MPALLRQDKLTMAARVSGRMGRGGAIPRRGFLQWSRNSWSLIEEGWLWKRLACCDDESKRCPVYK